MRMCLGASKASLTWLPRISTTVRVMWPPMTTFSPSFRLRTNMSILLDREREGAVCQRSDEVAESVPTFQKCGICHDFQELLKILSFQPAARLEAGVQNLSIRVRF